MLTFQLTVTDDKLEPADVIYRVGEKTLLWRVSYWTRDLVDESVHQQTEDRSNIRLASHNLMEHSSRKLLKANQLNRERRFFRGQAVRETTSFYFPIQLIVFRWILRRRLSMAILHAIDWRCPSCSPTYSNFLFHYQLDSRTLRIVIDYGA